MIPDCIPLSEPEQMAENSLLCYLKCSMAKVKKITTETSLAEILDRPGAAEILARYQLPCLSCPLAAYEISQLSLGQVAERYGLPLSDLLAELNKKS